MLETTNQENNNQTGLHNFYPVNPPFGFIGVEIDQITEKLLYKVVEPELNSEEQETLDYIKKQIIKGMIVPLEVIKNNEALETYLRTQLKSILKNLGNKIPEENEEKLLYYIIRDFIGYGKIDLLIRDEKIEDISCNGVNTPIYVWHRDYESIPTNIQYNTSEELDKIVIRLAYRSGRQISISHPILEGTLPQGFRVQLTLEEVSKRGDTFTIRKFRENPYTIIDVIKNGTLSPEIAAYLWILVENGRSIMVCGATASGKTTLLNSISMFIKPENKVITIEDVRELRMHENWVPMIPRPSYQPGVAEITLFDLLKSSLRQRPDYIIVGEVRGEEAYTLFQAIATGHGGLCTIHSDSVEYAVKRLISRPMNIPDIMIPLMNVLLQIRRIKTKNKVVRKVDTVTEITGMDLKGEIKLTPKYKWDSIKDDYINFEDDNSNESIFKQISTLRHITESVLKEEMKNRTSIIKWMLNTNINEYNEVSEIIHTYYTNPEQVLSKAKFEDY
jgi:flagellar protein FlaI